MDLTVWLTLSGQKGDSSVSSKSSKQIKGQGCAHIWDKYHKKRQKKKKTKKRQILQKETKPKDKRAVFRRQQRQQRDLSQGKAVLMFGTNITKRGKNTKSCGVLETAKAANRQKGKAALMF